MAVTPNYGWPIPVATDYVKDGYDAIADLGNAIDTTVAGLGSAGFTQIVPTSIAKGASGTASASAGGTVTYSGTESISLNGVFTSTYQNYKIILDIAGSGNIRLFSRLRASGSDNSTSNYASGIWRFNANNTSADVPIYQTGQNYMEVGYLGSYDILNSMEISNPQTAKETRFLGLSNTQWPGVGATAENNVINTFSATTQFDGITFYASSGTISGTLYVYGYKAG